MELTGLSFLRFLGLWLSRARARRGRNDCVLAAEVNDCASSQLKSAGGGARTASPSYAGTSGCEPHVQPRNTWRCPARLGKPVERHPRSRRAAPSATQFWAGDDACPPRRRWPTSWCRPRTPRPAGWGCGAQHLPHACKKRACCISSGFAPGQARRT